MPDKMIARFMQKTHQIRLTSFSRLEKLKKFSFFKIDHPRPLFHLFAVLVKQQYNYTKIKVKMTHLVMGF